MKFYEEKQSGKTILYFTMTPNKKVWFTVGGETTLAARDHLMYCVMHPFFAEFVQINWKWLQRALKEGIFEDRKLMFENTMTFPESYL
jgi:hypothetical protein